MNIPAHLVEFPWYAPHLAWLRERGLTTLHDPGDARPARADLSGAVLCGADLHGVDLRGANLCFTVLIGANLRFALLSGADTSGADMRGADMYGVAHLAWLRAQGLTTRHRPTSR